MEKNVGVIDQSFRLIIGPILIASSLVSAIYGGSLGNLLAIVFLVLGIILVLTGITQKCLIKKLFGIEQVTTTSYEDITSS